MKKLLLFIIGILVGQFSSAQEHAVTGITAVTNKAGVYGENSSVDDGMNQFGVYGLATGSSTGHGVYGVGTNVGTLGLSGIYGLYGWCNTNGGFSGYFLGGNGIRVFPADAASGDPIVVGDGGNDGNGAHLTKSGMWTNASSRTFKTNGQSINKATILHALSNLTIEKWTYLGNENEWHMGPYAEDFKQAFGLGSNSKYIQTGDIDGVALVAIQALYEEVKQLKAEIRQLKKALSE